MENETFYHVAPLIFLQHTNPKPEHYGAVMTFCREFVEIGACAKFDAIVQEYLYAFTNTALPTLQGKDYTIAEQFAKELISKGWGQFKGEFAICEDCGVVFSYSSKWGSLYDGTKLCAYCYPEYMEC